MNSIGKTNKLRSGISPDPVTKLFSGKDLWVKLKTALRVPVVSNILQHRLFAVALIITACVQTGLAACGVNGWPCPFRSILGIPCPGCGLSTALVHLFHGNWMEAFYAHAFAPVFFIGFIAMAGMLLLPKGLYGRAVKRIETFEKATGWLPLLLIGMLIYWAVRLFTGI